MGHLGIEMTHSNDVHLIAFVILVAVLAIGLALFLISRVQELSTKKLQASETRFRTLIQDLQVGVLLIGPQSEILVSNQTCVNLLDLPEQELYGKLCLNLCWNVIQEDLTEFPNQMHPVAQAIATRQPVHNVVMGRYRPQTQDLVWLLVNAEPQLAADGSIEQVICTFSDITESKRSQEALRYSEEQFRQLAENINEVFWVMSPDGSEILYISPAYEKIWKRSCESLYKQPQSWITSVYPADQARVFAIWEQCCQQPENAEFDEEYRIVQPDGSIRWIWTRNFSIRNQKGEIYRIVGIGTDITERKQAAEKLQRSEAQLRMLATQMQELARQESLVRRLSNQIRNSLDLKMILGTAVNEIHSLLQITRCRFLWYRTDVEQPHFELMHEACDPRFSNWGKSDFLAAVPVLGQTILKLKMLRVNDLATDLNFDAQSRNFLVSQGLTSLLAVSIQTHTGRVGVLICEQVHEACPWKDEEVELLQAVADQLAIAIDQAELYTQSRFAAITAQIQAKQLEKAISDLQNTQAQLIHTEKMSSLGQMIAGVAHEINNPINFIQGNLQYTSDYIQDLLALVNLYQQEFPTPGSEIEQKIDAIELDYLLEDLPKSLSSMQVGAERISQIVLSLRNFSRLDEAEMKPVNIHEGLDNTLLILQHRLQPKRGNPSIEVLKEYGDLPPVQCYAGQLNQVFMNILANAIDVLETQAVPRIITIKTEVSAQRYKSQPSIRIHIADNGSGISDDVKKRLFDPFFTTKPVGSGTGLGLSISYQIVVEKHKGQLQCISSPGKGAEFLIEIPIEQPARKLSTMVTTVAA